LSTPKAGAELLYNKAAFEAYRHKNWGRFSLIC